MSEIDCNVYSKTIHESVSDMLHGVSTKIMLVYCEQLDFPFHVLNDRITIFKISKEELKQETPIKTIKIKLQVIQDIQKFIVLQKEIEKYKEPLQNIIENKTTEPFGIKAIVYTKKCYESLMAYVHRDSILVTDLYIPELSLSANIVNDSMNIFKTNVNVEGTTIYLPKEIDDELPKEKTNKNYTNIVTNFLEKCYDSVMDLISDNSVSEQIIEKTQPTTEGTIVYVPKQMADDFVSFVNLKEDIETYNDTIIELLKN